MVRRIRTAKKLGTRHDLNYFKRWTGTRRWRVILSLAVPAILVVWLVVNGTQGDTAAFSSGPMSSVHAVFGQQCSTCHLSAVAGKSASGFKHNATDEACLACHEAPPHKPNQIVTPTCGSCHVEHVGATRLAHTSDKSCLNCHADLKTTSGPPRVEAAILGFNRKHPEFAVLRTGRRDPGTIALNHALHMKPIAGPAGKVQMECADCHRSPAEAAAPWPYAAAGIKSVVAPVSAQDTPQRGYGRAFMLTPTFEKTCAACHVLPFDPRIPGSVPHDKPEIVRAFILAKLREYIADHPTTIREKLPGSSRIPGSPPEAQPRSPSEWVTQQAQVAEQLLWRKTCKQCHSPAPAEGVNALPRILPAAITERWMPLAHFDHFAHQALTCVACHTGVPGSLETKEVLLPSVESCRSCHNGTPDRIGRAENSCFECHQYHDWKQRKALKGRFTVEQLTGGTR